MKKELCAGSARPSRRKSSQPPLRATASTWCIGLQAGCVGLQAGCVGMQAGCIGLQAGCTRLLAGCVGLQGGARWRLPCRAAG